MALLGKWTGGVDADLDPPASWAEATTLFPTEDRNDSSTYGKSNATITLPASGLADGYLFVGGYEFEDTSNGRCNPQARFIQASGTGTFVSASTGGYNRDNSEDRSYVRTWAFVDGPSASSTYTFQWQRDTDAPNTGDGSVRSELQVIPFYYSDIGLYTSTSTTVGGGTTPVVVTGFSGTDGTNITIASNVVSCTGDNKRYLVLGGQYWESLTNNARTQRWHGLDIDGVQEDAAKAYSFYRNNSNDESGDLFTWLFETVTATVTIEQTCYRGDGVAALQGGADADNTSGVTAGAHSLVVIELNDDAEVFRSRDDTQSANLATTGPIDLQINTVTDFNDTASFTDAGADTSINCVQTADYLFGANIACASNLVSTGTRWTAYSEITVNGTEDSDSVAGDYMRNNQSSADTFGWSANLLGFQGLTAGDDVGISVTELSGSEGGGGAVVSPAGWSGFWGLNLDTLEAAGSSNETVEPGAGACALAGIAPSISVSDHQTTAPPVGSLALSGPAASAEIDHNRQTGEGSLSLAGVAPAAQYGESVNPALGCLNLVTFVGLELRGQAPTIDVTTGASPIVEEPGAASLVLAGAAPSAEISVTETPGVGTLALNSDAPTVVTTANHAIGVPAGALALASEAPSAEISVTESPSVGVLVLAGVTPITQWTDNHTRAPPVDSLVLAAVAPSAEITHNRSVPIGSLSLNSDAPTANVGQSKIASPLLGSLVLNGVVPAVFVEMAEAPGSAALVLGSDALIVQEQHDSLVPVGALSFASSAPTLFVGQLEAPPAGTLVLSSDAPSAEIDHDKTPATASLVLSGVSPSAEIDHFRQAGAGSLTFTGAAPSLIEDGPGVVSPGAGRLCFVGHSERWGVGLVFGGEAPTVSVAVGSVTEQPGAGSLTLAGQAPTIGTSVSPSLGSLTINGLAPSLFTEFNATPLVGSLVLTGAAPTAIVPTGIVPGVAALVLASDAPSITAGANVIAEPSTGSLTFSSAAPVADEDHIVIAVAGALTLASAAPVADTEIVPAGALNLLGYAPTPYTANIGTEIANPGASTSVANNYEQCDFSGFRQLPGSLKMTWNKHAVRKKSWEERHPQDYVKSRAEKLRGPRRPEQDDRFVGTDIDEVSEEDL